MPPRGQLRPLALLLLLALAGCSGWIMTAGGADGPAQTAYPPPSGKWPIVVLLSGHSGPGYYQPIAGAVAKLGYYAVLLDGKDILTREQDGRANLRKAIERAQASPSAVPGKAAVIGSMRAIERGARERARDLELVVYPYAAHGFNLSASGYYRGDDEADAWKRTVEMLRRHQPLR